MISDPGKAILTDVENITSAVRAVFDVLFPCIAGSISLQSDGILFLFYI
jgi:methionine salvage enolase-phosphatase E1